MKVLILGSGAREHALGWRLAQDRGVEVISAPGNAGLATVGGTFSVEVTDIDAVVTLARQEEVDLVIVGADELPIDDLELLEHLKVGNRFLVGDGLVELSVVSEQGGSFTARVKK